MSLPPPPEPGSTEARLAALEAEQSRERYDRDPKEPADFAGDKVGAGRYILGFLIANIFGLWAVYWARYYGWRGIWISLVIAAVSIGILVASGEFVGCQEGFQDGPQGYGYYTCN